MMTHSTLTKGAMSLLVTAGLAATMAVLPVRAAGTTAAPATGTPQGMAACKMSCCQKTEKKAADHQQDMMTQFYKAINATPAQQQQLQALHQQTVKEMQPLMNNMMQQRQELMTYIASPNATQEEAKGESPAFLPGFR